MKSKTTKIILLITLLTVLFAIILFIIVNYNKISIYIDKNQSYLSDFKIDDNKVQIVCFITVCNEYNTDKTVFIKGNFTDDAKIGLLTDKILYATDANGEKCKYTLSAKEKKSFYITFTGDFGETEKMSNRNLPEIIIEEVS